MKTGPKPHLNCIDCGKLKTQIDVEQLKSIKTSRCYECYQKYRKIKYEQIEKLRRFELLKDENYRQAYYKRCRSQDRKRYLKYGAKRHYDYLERNIETFLKWKLKGIINADKKKNRENDLDLNYLLKLWEIQKGICTATGIKMTYKVNDITGVSVDRIDNTKGHIKNNIQLVCNFYNYGKQDWNDNEARAIIEQIKGSKKSSKGE